MPLDLEAIKALAAEVERYPRPLPDFPSISQVAERRLATESVAALVLEVERLRALLKRIEWVDTSGGEYADRCPCCGVEGPTIFAGPYGSLPVGTVLKPAQPHKPDCDLARALTP